VGRFPGRLHADVDGAPRRVGPLDGQWNPFTLLAEAQDDELSRPVPARNAWCMYDETLDSRGNKGRMKYFEHRHPVMYSR
jgi:hypothetical protein